MKKILLIEDNPDIRENTVEILEMSEYKVFAAENGKVGVELAKKHIPDLIICDIMMPELDGYGVLYLLGKTPETASIPFIFLTAKADRADFRKGMDMGADDYLTKPFTDMELLNAVESRLKKNETLKKEFRKNLEDLREFIDEAQGLEDLKKLSDGRVVKNFRKKELIFSEGEYPNAVYFINKGKVKRYKSNEAGKEYITAMHKEGDFLGYIALLEESQYQDSAMAIEDTEIYVIPKRDFYSLVFNNREVSVKFIKMLSDNLVELEERLIKLAYNSIRKRVAEALIFLQKRYSKQPDQPFSMSITRDDLASIVGTAKESVIRTLSDFKDENLIEINGGNITIRDERKLANMRN